MVSCIGMVVATKKTFGKPEFFFVKGKEKTAEWQIMEDDCLKAISHLSSSMPADPLEIDDFYGAKIFYFANGTHGRLRQTGPVKEIYVRIEKFSLDVAGRHDALLSTGEGYRKGPLGSVYLKWKR